MLVQAGAGGARFAL